MVESLRERLQGALGDDYTLERAIPRRSTFVVRRPAPRRSARSMRALYARALALGGHPVLERQELAALEREAAHRYVSGVPMAAAYGVLGETDAAFRSLERAVNDRAAELATLPLRGMLAPLEHDPRYAVIMHRMTPLDPH